ncbi:hypothetical protein PGT21_024548 [Puccinia graminis f. sp. tritici]|uniref:Uncharacterized protein n=1 Tax=Puccinia graminis f. sp. tritici TaxID=56615 RepID=A0A5B0R1F8_PUCGR|nr:hypothetical protein PGT21_024548 [Puccinia graminis f. sp. tritici]
MHYPQLPQLMHYSLPSVRLRALEPSQQTVKDIIFLAFPPKIQHLKTVADKSIKTNNLSATIAVPLSTLPELYHRHRSLLPIQTVLLLALPIFANNEPIYCLVASIVT